MDSILIVHRSRVVRATLALHLKSLFEIQEATDSESGWQQLVLQHGIVAVICGLDVAQDNDVWATSTRISGVDTQLSGIELLDRVRYSNLERLKTLPFYLIGSETHISEISEEARRHAVTGFLYNGMSRDRILRTLGVAGAEQAEEGGEKASPTSTAQSFLSSAGGGEALFAPPQDTPAQAPNIAMQTLHRVEMLSPMLFRDNLERLFVRPGTQASVLVFGVDRYERMLAQMKHKSALRILEQAAQLVQKRLRSGDSLGYIRDGAFAVATPVKYLEKCAVFAERVIHGLSSAKISVQGKPAQYTWSAGVASSMEDGKSGGALLDLALARLDAAIAANGNRVQFED